MSEWISTKDRLPEEDTNDIAFWVFVYADGESYAQLPFTGYFLNGKFCDNQDTEYEYEPWDGKSKDVITTVEWWMPLPPLPEKEKEMPFQNTKIRLLDNEQTRQEYELLHGEYWAEKCSIYFRQKINKYLDLEPSMQDSVGGVGSYLIYTRKTGHLFWKTTKELRIHFYKNVTMEWFFEDGNSKEHSQYETGTRQIDNIEAIFISVYNILKNNFV